MFPSLKRFTVYSLVLLISLASCKNEEPVTPQDAIEFGKTLEQSIKSGDEQAMNAVFDQSTFGKRVLKASDNRLKSSYVSNIGDNLQKANMGRQVIDAIEKGGSYTVLRNYEKDKVQHVIFRLYADGAINYHDFELVKRNGKVKAADLFIYLTGDNLSKSLADVLLTVDNNIKTEDSEELTNMTSIKKLMMQKHYEEAKTSYDELRPVFKNTRVFQLMNIEICKNLGDSIYVKSLEEYGRLFPHDSNLPLMMIDAYFINKDFPKVMEAINKLDSMVGGDPMQDYYRGLVYGQMEKETEAKEKLEKLYKAMPEFIPGMEELIAAYVKSKDYEKLKPIFEKYKKGKKVNKQFIQGLYILYPDLHNAIPQDAE